MLRSRAVALGLLIAIAGCADTTNPDPEPTDETPPSVLSTVPANGAGNVPVTTTVSATFSEEPSAATIGASSFSLSSAGGTVSGTASLNGTTGTFTPSAALAEATLYTARLTTAVEDAAGNGLQAEYTWSFTTTETTPPTVSAQTPALNATDVPLTTTVTATFSEAVQASTVTATTFTLTSGAGAVTAAVALNGNTATLTPSAPLTGGTVYTATVAKGVKDIAGNELSPVATWTFTTIETVPPTVSTRTPANAATNVAISTTVTATFSEAVRANTVTTSTFTLSSSGGAVTGTVTLAGNTATFTPAAALAGNTLYTATVTTGVLDIAGNALAANSTWSFTTIETTPPTVTSRTPAVNATGVAIGVFVEATFSEAVQAGTINTTTFTVTGPTGPAIAGTVSLTGNTARFTPAVPLTEFTTQYTARLTTGVRDIAGNALAAVTWTFTTELVSAAHYYRLTNLFLGDNTALDTFSDTFGCFMTGVGNFSGQFWYFTPAQPGHYRIRNQFQGDGQSLEAGVADGVGTCALNPTGNFTGQNWYLTALQDGYYRLRAMSFGDVKSLDTNPEPRMTDTGNFSGQFWRLTRLGAR